MVELHYEQGRWIASCGHCGAPLVGADDQAPVEAVLAALEVPAAAELGADDAGRLGD